MKSQVDPTADVLPKFKAPPAVEPINERGQHTRPQQVGDGPNTAVNIFLFWCFICFQLTTDSPQPEARRVAKPQMGFRLFDLGH